MNRPVTAGQRVQVIEASGVRLGVWSEDDVTAEIENHRFGGHLGRGHRGVKREEAQ
jgi:hypothetical protein